MTLLPTNAVSPFWVRDESDRLAIAEGCYFDPEAGEIVCDFIESFCVQSIDKWAGRLIELMPWQRDFLMRLFGWRRADGRRRFETGYLEIGKKNGKSTLLSALELALLLVDGQATPQIFINAVDRGQASIIFDETVRMIRKSPRLMKRLHVVDHKKRIVWAEGNGAIIANSADSPNKDGLNPSAVLWDELHRQPDFRLWDVFKYAGSARSEPLRIAITTAGEDDSGPWFEQRDFSEKTSAGVNGNTTHLGVIYRCDPDDDLDDPEVWRKANPSLGFTVDPEKFAKEWEEAKASPRETPGFKRLRFNIITKSDVVFIPIKEWDACRSEPRPGAFRDVEACGGVDLSAVCDLTASATLVGNEADGYDLLCSFYLPEDGVLALEKIDRVPYRVWAGKGYLTLTPGSTLDYSYVRRDLNELAGRKWDNDECRYEPSEDTPRRVHWRVIKCDEWNALQFAQEVREEDGINLEFIGQGYRSLSAPTKELERLVKSRKIRHDGNPVMRWCLSNAVAVKDDAGNLKLSKKKSRQKIDGAYALVNALAGLLPGKTEGEATHDENTFFLI